MASVNDLEFNLVGYFWMLVNCMSTAGYILYMRYASTSIKLPRFGMVFYNNLLSTMMLIPLCIMNEEYTVFSNPNIFTKPFILTNIFAGCIGFYLNFASLFCVAHTSATTYSIVGSFNKVPVLFLGVFLFHAKITFQGYIFIFLATLGTFMHAYSKLSPKKWIYDTN